jgi:hypothetical protein
MLVNKLQRTEPKRLGSRAISESEVDVREFIAAYESRPNQPGACSSLADVGMDGDSESATESVLVAARGD